MVVDDDAPTARMIALALREDGYSVRCALDGRDALTQLEGGAPDLIVLDLEMPGMNGRAFYHELRARGLEVPVVIVSAFDAHAAQRELGANTYLTKPFDPDDLLARVRSLLT
jgi:DNA-binding response OmpR family regulator